MLKDEHSLFCDLSEFKHSTSLQNGFIGWTLLFKSYAFFFFFLNVGILLPELVVSVVLLLSKNAGLMQEAGAVPLLGGLLEHLDRFNHLAPGKERDDHEELAWPGIMGMAS